MMEGKETVERRGKGRKGKEERKETGCNEKRGEGKEQDGRTGHGKEG